MIWIAPSEKDTATTTLEKRLRDAAEQFRANSCRKSREYFVPGLDPKSKFADEIGANAALETRDLDHGTLKSRGGLPRALALFGKDSLPTLLEKLNTALAA